VRTPPYLPFRDGPPDFVVGLKPIPLDAWLEPDVEGASLPAKRELLATRLDEVYRAGPDAAASEAAVARLIGAATYLHAAARVSDDLVIMTPRAGAWIAASVCLCSPTFFSADDAFGKPLDALHEPVPDRLGPEGTAALGARIGRVFTGLAPDTVLERFNWTVQAGPERFTPRGQALRERATRATPDDAAALMHLRVERQTIRKLTTGDVLFTIRVSIDPLAPMLMAAGGDARAFSAAWASASADARGYKGWAVYDRLVASLCREIGVPSPERLEDAS